MTIADIIELQTESTIEYTAISEKVVIVNSRYWNRKELWSSSSTNNLLLLALTLQNMECRFIRMPRPHSNNLRLRELTMTVPKVPFCSSNDSLCCIVLLAGTGSLRMTSAPS